MADWPTISSLATAGGTLVLAIATFSSVRSANRAARTAERAFQAGMRPVLVPTRMQDEEQKVMWVDRHWAKVPGGFATVELIDGNFYLALSLRNVGSGIAVLHGWDPLTGLGDTIPPHAEPGDFRMLTRDLYVAPGDIGFCQGAIRDPTDPDYDPISRAIKARERMAIDVLYGDHEGGQRTVTRFGLTPRGEDGDQWICSIAKHWNIDRDDPR
jgi:hypothetical protein